MSSNRIFGTEKVDNIIGLRDQNVYDSIDIYVDKANNGNIWGIVHYTEYKNHKPIEKQEIVHFLNHQAMLDYVRANFNGYELDHPVDISKKQIFFHFVNYCNLNYYVHEGKPNLNYIEIRFLEFEDGRFVSKSIKLDKKYEEMFKMILRASQKLPDNVPLSPVYYRDVDAYEERANNRKEVLRSVSLPIEEFFSMAGNKIKKVATNKKMFRRLKIFLTTTAIAAIIGGGYKLVTDNIYNSEYIVQNNPFSSLEDIGVYINKGKMGLIIDKLVHEKYDEVTPDELKSAIEFIGTLEAGNYDNNASFYSFNYTGYFDYEVDSYDLSSRSSTVLKKIETLYNACFYESDGRVVIRKENVQKYIDYVASLTFMYNVYHTDRPRSLVSIPTDSYPSKYAKTEDIETYDHFPPILRYIILNQMNELLKRCDYSVTERPAYYFKEMDKYSLLTEIKEEKDSVLNEIYFQCGYSYRKNSI